VVAWPRSIQPRVFQRCPFRQRWWHCGFLRHRRRSGRHVGAQGAAATRALR